MTCKLCGSYAINPQAHKRKPKYKLDLCDVCYWRTEAEEKEAELVAARKFIAEQSAEFVAANPGLADKNESEDE